MAPIYLLCAIVATAFAQIIFKYAITKRHKIWLATALLLFCIAPLMSCLALKTLSLSTVYMATGLTYVLVILMAKCFLKEQMTKQKISAMLLIVAGVIVFNI
nr:SMR family transporter [uncultured Pseudodesulfovibrio sp.]